MAIPRIFVSSTCYDLKYIRENLKYFIKTLGYEPILSEEGGVFFNPKQHTQEACLAEVPNCQVFILIIGGRFGEQFKGQDVSVTNAEYREAIKLKIPVFTLVEQAVYNESFVYQKNKLNKNIDQSKIIYPSTDSIKIFDFIEEVRSSSVNNAIVPFKDFSDIESYLRQQWAAMFFYFLTSKNEEQRVADNLSILTSLSQQIAMLSKQILSSVGTQHAKVTARLFEEMVQYECVRDAGYFSLKPTPVSVLMNNTFLDWIKYLGKEPRIYVPPDDESEISISGDGSMSKGHLAISEKTYKQLKEKLLDILKQYKLSVEQYLAEERKLTD